MTNAHQRRPTQVNAGPQHPTKANAGPRRQKRDRYVFFCNVHFIFHFLITTKPTKANNGQRRPTGAKEGQCTPTTANSGQRSQRKPTQASPPRPRRTFIGIFFSFTQKLSLFTNLCYY